jgi:ribosomal protein S18 acetylase RimI-like enzyme
MNVKHNATIVKVQGKGLTIVDPQPDCTYIESINVRPEHRRQGLATAMLNKVFEVFPPPYHLHVSVTNYTAIALYKKLGFRMTTRTFRNLRLMIKD